MLKVGELEEYLAKREEGTVAAKLSEFSVDSEATELRITTGFNESTAFTLDDTANHALATYLKIPPNYFKKLTPDFRATLLEYEFDRHQGAQTVVESLKGNIVSVHQPTDPMLPLDRVGQVIIKVMNSEDTIRRMATDDKRFHLDITTEKSRITFPANTPELLTVINEGVHVGDITEGGLRVLAYPFQSKNPSVGAYLERLVCTNGMCSEERFGAISLKGRTVDEVIISMEEAANEVLGSLDAHLKEYATTRNMTVPGSPQAFAAQLAREAGVSRKVLDKILAIVNQLPEPVTVWDVNQAFTSVANEMETYTNLVRLQTMGGHLAMNAEKMVERCKSCEQPLP